MVTFLLPTEGRPQDERSETCGDSIDMKLTGKHKALMAGSRAIAGIAGFVSCCGVTTADRTDTGVATETAGERVRAVPTCVVCIPEMRPS